METSEQHAVMAIALLAAFADGSDEQRERAELQRVADSLGATSAVAALVKDVLLKRVTLPQAVAALTTPQARQLAYELAVGVCDADELRNDAETRFLADLGAQLGLSQPDIVARAVDADELATLPLASGTAPAGDVVAATPSISEDQLDQIIMKAAVLNGALELLPQTLATMAIIPLQMKLVHRIGRAYGYESDRTQIRDLLATLGVGLTGQYLETIGRRLLGGLFGKAGGGLLGSLASGATGAAFSFASTYAIGSVARRYYAGGRVMSAELLRASFAEMLAQGRTLQQRYLPQIEAQARALNPAKLVQMVREF